MQTTKFFSTKITYWIKTRKRTATLYWKQKYISFKIRVEINSKYKLLAWSWKVNFFENNKRKAVKIAGTRSLKDKRYKLEKQVLISDSSNIIETEEQRSSTVENNQ